MSIGLNDTVVARDGVFATPVDDELVLLDPESGTYFGAGATGELIWRLMAEGAKVSDLCDAVLSEFDVERSTCEQDVIAFINDLADRELVTKR
jgi:hypothetical protein